MLIAAEQELGAACAALVCTAGRPSDAVRLLLSTVRQAGVRVRHHGDFDEAGVQIFRDLEGCYDAVPWRFDAAALSEALEARAPMPWPAWPASLEDGVRRVSSGLAEEMLIEDLVADLASAAR